MKMFKLASLLVCILAVCVASTGCKKKPGYLTPLPGQRNGQTAGLEPGGKVNGTGETGSEKIGSSNMNEGIAQNAPGIHDGWLENAEALKADTIYFDFDSSSIKSSEQPRVSAVAEYLKSNAGVAVRVEGHCDERGTEEYNRSLGQRRASAIREALVALGITPDRVDTLSYGEDRPAVQGQNEGAYAKNRRAEFIVLTPPNK